MADWLRIGSSAMLLTAAFWLAGCAGEPPGKSGGGSGSNGMGKSLVLPRADQATHVTELCACTGSGPSGPVTVSCGQSACGSDYATYVCGSDGWTWTGQACSGNGDAGICQCAGSGPGGHPVTVSCGESACGSDFTTYACSAAGWLSTGQSCTCSCSGTGPGSVPVTVYCGQSACGSDFTTYACSAAGWSWTSQSCNSNSDAGVPPSADAGVPPSADAGTTSDSGLCQCSGSGPGGYPVTVDCGQSACGSDFTTYGCSAAGWSSTDQSCNCSCSGTSPGGVPVTAYCGQSACGSDYTTYSCGASGWIWTGQSCTCECSGTGPGGVPVTVSCGQSACGSDFTSYACSASGWTRTGQSCTGAGSRPCYSVHGLNFSPYIAADEDPRKGPPQITPDELASRLAPLIPNSDWIRTFSCNSDLEDVGRLVHQAGRLFAMGAWIGPVSTQAGLDANAAEIRCLCDHIAQGDVDLAVVGSEALLRGDVTETQLLGYLQQVRTCATQASKNTQVTSADTYGALLSHPNVLAAVDLVFANYYPYWEGRDVQQAVAYIHRWHQQLQAAAPGKEVVVSETGWPTCGASVGDAVPSPSNAALFFLNFVSWARALNVKYFYFEAYDEAWKVHTEGTQGACWGLWDAQGQLKQGMQPVFDCSTIPDNWTNPPSTTPIFAFPSLPEHITTNLPSFLVASTAATADTVAINGVVIPANAFDASGNFATIVPLDLGDNTIELVVTAGSTTVSSTHKTVTYDPSYSTSGRRLVYVDVVSPAASGMPQIDGTIVVDLDASTPLGVVTNRHAVGIAPNGGEIYMADRSVLETATHQIVRQLAFANTIVSNGFLVSPDGTRLYSSNERLDVATNTLLAPLPASIVTGNSWAGNPIPGGPAISPDGRKIYYGNTLGVIDTVDNLATSWNIAPIYLSDLAVSPDGNTLLMSRYAYTTGSVVLYKISDHTQLAALGGLGDFSGEIAPIPGTSFFVAGSAGNPASPTDGKLVTFQADSTAPVSSLTLPLGDNLVASKRGEVIASSGENALFRRAGLDVYLVDASGHLSRDKTIFLGINAFVASSPIPKNDQIRRILLKEFDGAR